MIKYTEKYVINRDTESPSQKPRSERPASAENSAQRGLSIEKHGETAGKHWAPAGRLTTPNAGGHERQVPPGPVDGKRQLLSKTRGRHPAPRARVSPPRTCRLLAFSRRSDRAPPKQDRTGWGQRHRVRTAGVRGGVGLGAGRGGVGGGAGLGAGPLCRGKRHGQTGTSAAQHPSSAFPRSTRAAVASGPVAVAVLHCGC